MPMLHQLISPQLLDSKILVVDDDDWNCAYVFEVLSAYGFRSVSTISNSAEVLASIQAHPPDLLILDIYMPEPDGFAILAGMKSVVPEGCELPVLVITSGEDGEVKQRALELGATDFLPKPFEEIVVAARVANLLRVHEHGRKSAAGSGEGAALTGGSLQALLSKIPAGVVLVDNEGVISYANEEFCRLFSIQAAAEELRGEQWSEAVHGLQEDFRDKDAFVSGDETATKNGVAVDRQALQMLDGRVLERDYVPLKLESGSRGHLWIFRDVTLANSVQAGAAS